MELRIYSETELKDLLSNKLGVDKEEARSCVTTVSKTLDSMASPFDAEATARKCYEKAQRMGPDYKYHGMSVQDILDYWDRKNKDACECGRLVDDYIGSTLDKSSVAPAELAGLNGRLDAAREEWRRKVACAGKTLNALAAGGYEFMSRERDLCDPPARIRGRYDATYYKGGAVWLFDWKSNDEITVENKYENFHGPMMGYPECKYYRYSMQLYIYKYILRMYYGVGNDIKTAFIQMTENDPVVYSTANLPYSDELVNSVIEYGVMHTAR